MIPMITGVLSPWFRGILVFLVWTLGLIAVMRIAYVRLKSISRQTRTDLDNVILGALSVPLLIVILISGGLILTKFLSLSAAWNRGLNVGVKIAFILAGVFFFDRLVKGFLRHYSARADYLRASSGIMQTAVRAVILLLALFMILDMAGVSITPLLASLGVGSLALALALQSPLANFFAGLQLVADKPIQVGHYIKLNTGEEGRVTRIGWRATTITAPGDNCVIIPNSKIADAIITNYDLPETETLIFFQVGVHYQSDLDLVERVTKEVAADVLQSVAGGVGGFEPVIRFTAFGDSRVELHVTLRADRMTNTYVLRHEFIKRLHKRYREEGITIPFPTRSLDISRESLLVLRGEPEIGTQS